jgi:cell wall assembly regulator SMI1
MNSGQSVAALWQRLESWAGENAPEMLRDLNPGADEKDISGLEEAFGHSLPASYRDSLMVHNGESDGWPSRVFADMGAYHSAESALHDYNMSLKICSQFTEFDESEIAEQIEGEFITVEGPVRPLTFSPDWLPILNSNGDVFWALDFAPDDGGVKGQVIQIYPEGCYWAVVAPDFATFFENYVSDLEKGEYEVQEGIATRDPVDAAELARDRLFANSISKDQLEQKAAGELVNVVGICSGTGKNDRCVVIINGGEVRLRGSVQGLKLNQMLRATIKIGKPRAFGLLAPAYTLVEWEVVE